ncbi:MAG: hypothetical protein CL610_01725 [Anaerolineaceae bacterium]|nr:hypothetical protein [Anaerolineaceae bacterium]
MPANVYWLDEPDIMIADYTGDLTREDVEGAMEKCLAALENTNCSFVVDTTQVQTLPKDIFRIGPLLSLVNHPQRGWLIFVGQQNVMLKFAVQVIVRHKFRFMESRDEAVALLRSMSGGQDGSAETG